jgi:hypothetical protein
VYAYAAQSPRVDVGIVQEVLTDKSDSVLLSQRREARQPEVRKAVPQADVGLRPASDDNDPAARDVLRDLFSSLRAKS